MNTQQGRHPILELGAFSFVVLMVWAIAALVGFVVLANWAELFAAEESARAAPSADLAPVTAYVGSDPSLPPASTVFAGHSYEVSQPIDTF